jgi:hypothetical protein
MCTYRRYPTHLANQTKSIRAIWKKGKKKRRNFGGYDFIYKKNSYAVVSNKGIGIQYSFESLVRIGYPIGILEEN